VFSRDRDPRIVEDARVLGETFIPERILHRDTQLEVLKSSLFYGKTANFLLYGGAGTGKSAVVRWLFRELERQTAKVKPIYINVWEYPSRFNTLYEVASSVCPFVSRRGTASSELLERIQQYLRRAGKSLVVCLDEVDQLRDRQVLYNLLALGSSLILIANRREALVGLRLNARIKSRIGSVREIEFPPYTTEELVDILKDRARIALKPDAISEFQIAHIAALVSQRNNSDARVGLRILRNSAVLAEHEGGDRIGDKHISSVWDETKAVAFDSGPSGGTG